MTLQRLKVEARASATTRGHKLSRFATHELRPGIASATCLWCGAGVTVNLHPLPNEIDIGGAAVAVNCGDKHHADPR